MTVATNIVLNDAAATPVAHTFQPTGYDPKARDTFWFTDRSATNSIGNWRISVQYKIEQSAPRAGQSSKGVVNRILIGLHEPTLETVSNNTVNGILPAPTIAYVTRSVTEYFLPERSTTSNRKDIAKMTSALLANAQIVNVVENLEYLN